MTADTWKDIINCEFTQVQKLRIQELVQDVYIDGWGDGQAHKPSLTPKEFSERIQKDLEDSWSNLIFEKFTCVISCPDGLVEEPEEFDTREEAEAYGSGFVCGCSTAGGEEITYEVVYGSYEDES
jgi:hypothetical protein